LLDVWKWQPDGNGTGDAACWQQVGRTLRISYEPPAVEGGFLR
jgi:hypothetical protein